MWDLDVDGTTPSFTGSPTAGLTDFWWEELSSSLYFNPQGIASFVRIQ